MTLKIAFLAYNLFQQLLEDTPMMTGCYDWIPCMKMTPLNWREIAPTRSRLEEFDVIQINADPMDLRLISEVRSILGNSSSTKLVCNQDHAPELWDENIPYWSEYERAIRDSDHFFCTSDTAQSNLQLAVKEREIHLIPHPCEVEKLKHFASFIHNEHCLFFWHRYENRMNIPYLATRDLPLITSVVGYQPEQNPRDKIFQFTKHWNVIPTMPFQDFIKVIKEAKIGYDPFLSWSYGRTPVDCAALGLPLVCSAFNYSSRLLFPKTCVDPMDGISHFLLLKRLLDDEAFREEVVSYAYDNVDYFNHKNSKERYLAMLDSEK